MPVGTPLPGNTARCPRTIAIGCMPWPRAPSALRSEGYVPFVSTPALDYLG